MTNKKDLAEEIYQKGLCKSKVDSEMVVDVIFDRIKRDINIGKVNIAKFGMFMKKNVKARTGQNPRTLEKVDIPEHSKVVFHSAKAFKDEINQK